MTAARHAAYTVAVHAPDGVQRITGWGEVNARSCYAAWQKQVGVTCTRVELWGTTADGVEECLLICDLRSDLHAGVKARMVAGGQMRLFEESQP